MKKKFKKLNKSPSYPSYADMLFSRARYERIVPPQLAGVFLNKLSEYRPFRDSNLTSIDPASFYVSPKEKG